MSGRNIALVVAAIVVLGALVEVLESPDTPATAPAPRRLSTVKPLGRPDLASDLIEPNRTTMDDAYAMLKQDNCGKAIDQSVKLDSKISGSLEVKQTYDCGGTKLELELSRLEHDGPYYVTYKGYVY